MKLSGIFLFSLFVSGFCAVSVAEKTAPSPDRSLSNDAAGTSFTSQQIVETWGWLVARQEDLAGIEINPTELASFLKGFVSGIHGQVASYDPSKASPDIERLSKSRREKLVKAVIHRNESEAKAFFSRLKKNTNVVELPGGLCFEMLKPGNGAFPKPQQTVNLHCTARLIDGTEFAQFGPMDMVLVTNHAPFPAWVEGLQKINAGGTIKLYVPPPLSEKEAFKWGIAPGSAMVFEVELGSVRETTEQELADELVLPAPDLDLPASGYTEAQLFETWGWLVAQKTRVAQFNLSEKLLVALTQGMEFGVKGSPSQFEISSIIPAVEKFINDHREQARLAVKRRQLAETEALFAKLKTDTNVVESPSGLRYEILKPGSGAYPKMNQFVNVNYIGRLIGGRIFDQTDPTLGPLDIKIGTVIPGWSEGVQKINKGGKIRLYIPPSLGYGEMDASGIPANSTLIFEIELLDIKDSLEGDAANGTEKK